MSSPILSVRGLSKSYGSFQAVNQLSFTVNEGDVYGFLGPNGAGKSTTIRMLLSLIYPDSGEVELFGKNLYKHREWVLSQIGAIVEKPDFYGYLSAMRNLEVLGRLQAVPVTRSRMQEVLHWVGLSDRANSPVKTFSQGMKQRLGLAQALLHQPKLIILDEPTNGLDPQGMRDIRELILSLQREQGITIFLSSHILSEVEIMANRMVIIQKGKAVVEGNVRDILRGFNTGLQVETSHADAFIERLGTSAFAGSLRRAEEHKIILNLAADQAPAVAAWMVESGLPIESISPLRTLEDYFISQT
jgi:ABC-2 type transport system ATP-binding protein